MVSGILLLLLGDYEILAFFIEILHVCWAPWISQVRALGSLQFLILLTTFFLDKGITCIFILTLKDPVYCSWMNLRNPPLHSSALQPLLVPPLKGALLPVS